MSAITRARTRATPARRLRRTTIDPRRVAAGLHHALRPRGLGLDDFANDGEHLNVGYNRTNSINVTAAVAQATCRRLQLGREARHRRTSPALPGRQFPNMGMGESILYLGRGNQDDNIDNGERLNEQFSWVQRQASARLRRRFPQPALLDVRVRHR